MKSSALSNGRQVNQVYILTAACSDSESECDKHVPLATVFTGPYHFMPGHLSFSLWWFRDDSKSWIVLRPTKHLSACLWQLWDGLCIDFFKKYNTRKPPPRSPWSTLGLQMYAHSPDKGNSLSTRFLTHRSEEPCATPFSGVIRSGPHWHAVW